MNIVKTKHLADNITRIYLVSGLSDVNQTELTIDEQNYIHKNYNEKKNDSFTFNRLSHYIHVKICGQDENYLPREAMRKAGDKLVYFLTKRKMTEVVLIPLHQKNGLTLAYVEGMALGAYRFDKYKSKVKDENRLSSVLIFSDNIEESEVEQLNNLVEACYLSRDFVNEPSNEQSAIQFADQIAYLSKGVDLEVKVFHKKEITEMGMTGLLTVNKGSIDEPAFVTLEWKPENSGNEAPIVLVGKGLVYDTGGINLKPGNGLVTMKSDMAGGASVFGVLYALAKNKIPLHVVGLIPASDNRPGENAMVPGDIITMGNGKTVEILNTDAEGRLILADALLYANTYNPKLVIDIATLTGSAAMAIGKYGIVAMQKDATFPMAQLIESGYSVFERVVEFPFWDEYGKEIESDIADIRNLGKSREGGAITAGKFLGHFTEYPWIHLDIAGMAFMDARESWQGKGGTAIGVRLLYDFLVNGGSRN